MADDAPLRELFVEELRDLYNAERQWTRLLPRLMRACSAPELKQLLGGTLLETRRQAHRLEQIARSLDIRITGKTCHAMEGLIADSRALIGDGLGPAAVDAGIIGAAQRAAHYEMAAYGTARTHARLLGHERVASLLQQTLDEELATDRTLTALAETRINLDALRN